MKLRKTGFSLCSIAFFFILGVGIASADVILGGFDFNSSQFGNNLIESDGGAFSKTNWLNIVNSDPGNPGYLTGANFSTGIANIGLAGAPKYIISYNTSIVNVSGYDLGIVTARYSTQDTVTLEVSSDGGSTFSSAINFGPSAAVATGVSDVWWYGGFGPYGASLFVTPVDLSAYGIGDGASINAIRITGSPELDLIRVAGLNINAVPEPGMLLLVSSGLIGLIAGRKMFKR